MLEIIKKHKVMFIILSGCAVIVLGLWNSERISQNNFYINKIGVDLPKQSVVLKQEEDHGGFHGDGEYYSEIQLTVEGATAFAKQAKKSGKWSALPLPKDIRLILHGSEFCSIGTMSKKIPLNIENGIYFVRDRLAEEDPNEKNTNIMSRHSYNVTISILDFNTKKLYIYELDT